MLLKGPNVPKKSVYGKLKYETRKSRVIITPLKETIKILISPVAGKQNDYRIKFQTLNIVYFKKIVGC